MIDGNAVVFHADVPHFAKTATISAVRMDHPFYVMTPEGRMVGDAGDWLVQADTDRAERWIIKHDIFEATYQEVEPDGA